jgi:hypothetical protein
VEDEKSKRLKSKEEAIYLTNSFTTSAPSFLDIKYAVSPYLQEMDTPLRLLLLTLTLTPLILPTHNSLAAQTIL